MADALTYSEIAELLGISRTLVMAIEKRALAKLAWTLGDRTQWEKLPKWIQRMGDVGIGRRMRCSVCGEPAGHNSRTCPKRPGGDAAGAVGSAGSAGSAGTEESASAPRKVG